MRRAAELERANYGAMLASAEVTPGLEVILRDDVILTSSPPFPTPDSNHACLVRATVETVDDVITEVTDYFHSKGVAPAVYLSPACAPGDLPERLSSYGYVQQGPEEAWMAVEPSQFRLTKLSPDVSVRQIEQDESLVFAETFLKAFDQPPHLAPLMAQLLEPSIGLANTHHYLAFKGGEPVGTASLLCFEDKGVFGGTGVVPEYRESRTGTNLSAKVKEEGQREGMSLLLLQTTAGTWLETQLTVHGFNTVFTRMPYVLPS